VSSTASSRIRRWRSRPWEPEQLSTVAANTRRLPSRGARIIRSRRVTRGHPGRVSGGVHHPRMSRRASLPVRGRRA
jgi:hypothetical protein